MYKIWDESNPKKEDLIFAIDPDLQVLQNFIKFCSLKVDMNVKVTHLSVCTYSVFSSINNCHIYSLN